MNRVFSLRQNIIFNFILLAAAWIVASACKIISSENLNDYGLSVFDVEMTDENRGKLSGTIMSKTPHPARLKHEGREYRVLLSHAGKSSVDHVKKSYNIDFKDHPDREVQLLRLSSQSQDLSMIRSRLGYWIYEQAGISVPDTGYGVLYINNVIQGLYHTIEVVEEGFFERRDIDLQYAVKANYGNADLSPAMVANIQESFKIINEDNFLEDSFAPILMLVGELQKNKEGQDNRSKVDSILNMQNIIDYYAASQVMNNWDGYDNNYILYLEEDANAQFHIVAWDLDRLLEDVPDIETLPEGYLIWGRGNELVRYIRRHPDLTERYFTRLRQLLEYFTPEIVSAYVDEQATAIASAYKVDRYLGRASSLDVEVGHLKVSYATWHASVSKALASL